MITNATNSVSNFEFFQAINTYLSNEIDYFQWTVMDQTMQLIGFVALILLTIWIMYQGFRIITGRARMPLMLLVGDALKAFLVISLATGMASSTSTLYWALTDGAVNVITSTINPKADANGPYSQIDANLATMEGMLGLLDTLASGANAATGTTTDSEVQSATSRAKWFTGIGIAGPSVVGGAVLLLNKIAIALFIGLGPLFILCLLFDFTKGLFQRWLFYGIGTMFSLAVLSFMVTIAANMVQAVTLSILAKYSAALFAACTFDPSALQGAGGITSMAMQQGGLGLLLSTLIVSAPPMAAAFFQGTLGQFMSYSAFGSVGARGSEGYSQALAQGRIPQSSAGQVSHSEQLLSKSSVPANTYATADSIPKRLA
jgi:type IV secretion system protein VirB6